MQFYKEKLLSYGQLKRLSEHKYRCTTNSILDGLLQPWWDWLVSKVPLWVAPNLITVLGLIVNIVTTLILIYYSPDAKAEAPRWACFLCALGLFIYQSLDAIDGKQARRTGNSTPLGELFDHGCDSISTVFVALSACIAVQLGYYPTWMFFQCFCAMTLFYCAHWQTYVSGSLRFGKVDVTEAQFTIITIHLISAVFGTKIWMMEIPYIDGFMFKYLIGVMTVICALANLYSIFSVIFTGGVGKNGSTVAMPVLGLGTVSNYVAVLFYAGYVHVFLEFCKVFESGGIGKNGSTIALPYTGTEVKVFPLWAAVGIAILLAQSSISVILAGGVGKNGSTVAGTSVLSPIIPFSFVVVPAFIIYRKSAEHVYENHPALYILAFGMVAAKVTNRLVVAHMTKNEMQYLDSSLIGPAMLFLNQYFNFFIKEYYVLWLCFIWVTLDLLRYSAQICLEICDYMKIDLYRIPLGDQRTNATQVSTTAEKNELAAVRTARSTTIADISNGELRKIITAILKDADLTTMLVKKVRLQIEGKLDIDLTERKKELDSLVMECLQGKQDGAKKKKTASEESEGGEEEEEEGSEEEEGEEEKQPAKRNPAKKAMNKRKKGSSDDEESTSDSDASDEESTSDSDASDKESTNDSDASDEESTSDSDASDEESASNSDASNEEYSPKKPKATPEKNKPGKNGKEKGSDRDSDEDWGKNKKAQGGDGGGAKKNGSKVKGDYTHAVTLSPELAAVVGAEQMARREVLKKICSVIKERNLYDPKNKQFVICDDELMKVIGVKRFRTSGMMKYLKKHFVD